MSKLNEIKEFFDKLCNTSLTKDALPELSSEESKAIVNCINNATAEADRQHILDIMNKGCSDS